MPFCMNPECGLLYNHVEIPTIKHRSRIPAPITMPPKPRFCSKECSEEYFDPDYYEYICGYCLELFPYFKDRAGRPPAYCSYECQIVGRLIQRKASYMYRLDRMRIGEKIMKERRIKWQ